MEFVKRLFEAVGRYAISIWRLPLTLRELSEKLDKKGVLDYRRFCPNPGCGAQLVVDKGTMSADHWRYYCVKCKAFFNMRVHN